jgi:hypothetical protein
MSKLPHPIRTAVATIATAIIATALLAFGPVSSAAAATATYLSVHPTVATPIAGQQVTMQVFTGSLAGNYPAGEVDVMVEGTGMMVGGQVSTSNGGIALNVGNFPIGTITVDATFTPTSGIYSPASGKATVTIAGAGDTIRPLFPTAPSLGHSVSAAIILFLASGSTRAPGGVVSFEISGKSVATCTPAPTDLVLNWSCSATLPAPTKSGAYTVTAFFGRSSYYLPSSGTQTATVAAKKSTPTKPAASSAPAGGGSTPQPVVTPTAQPSVQPAVQPAVTPVPVAADANGNGGPATITPSSGPWQWLFLGALVLLIAAVTAVLLLLRRRSMTRPVQPPS